MLVGAASSNLLDRFLRGAVVDFIAVRGWRIFNLADAAMFAGVLLTWSAL
jgi:lipoprotein signal peptidase